MSGTECRSFNRFLSAKTDKELVMILARFQALDKVYSDKPNIFPHVGETIKEVKAEISSRYERARANRACPLPCDINGG